MKELFNSLPRVTFADVLIDTCFLYYLFENHLEKEFIDYCEHNRVALTSFTVLEVLHHSHDVNHNFREHFRRLVKEGLKLGVIDISVHPGDPDGEMDFVKTIDEELIHLIPDHSDAVIAAVAVKLHANLLTRDKHHLFTTVLENYFSHKGIVVKNNF